MFIIVDLEVDELGGWSYVFFIRVGKYLLSVVVIDLLGNCEFDLLLVDFDLGRVW